MDVNSNKRYETDLKGWYQQRNINNSIVAIEWLQVNGWKINEEAIVEGLRNVVKNTQLLGRWQVLSQCPNVICDVGHNEMGVTEIVQQLNEMSFDELHIVLGTVNDKSIVSILNLLPKTATYYFCEANIPRALPVKELSEIAKNQGLTGVAYNSVNEALLAAKKSAKKEDLIFVGGSTFVVAEVV